MSWDANPAGLLQQWDISQGIIPMLSIRTTMTDGTPVPWASIASGADDAAIVAQARSIATLRSPVWVIFDHEPEGDLASGTPSDFVAAFRHYVGVYRSLGITNVAFAETLTSWSYQDGDITQWYAGDDVVDYLGADGYNWAGCRSGQPTAWTEFSDVFSAFHDFGVLHGKPMIVPEWGSVEDPADPGHKAQWIANAAATLRSWPTVAASSYYDWSDQACDWRLDSSAASSAAFAGIASGGWFGATPTGTLAASPMAAGIVTFTTSALPAAAQAVTSWQLDFGDGSAPATGAGTPPVTLSHHYAVGSGPATSTATLTVTDGDGQSGWASSQVATYALPSATTGPAGAISVNAAWVRATEASNGGPTSWWFEYGPTAAYGSTSSVGSSGSNATSHPVSAPLAGLAAGTTYHYRVVASSPAGVVDGQDVTFTTVAGLPYLATEGATTVSATSALLNGWTAPFAGSDTSYFFQWGSTTGYGSASLPVDVGIRGGVTQDGTALSGLQPSTMYHFRVVASNVNGTAYGADHTFVTGATPTVVTGTASATRTGVWVHGSVAGGGTPTTWFVKYGPSTAYGSQVLGYSLGRSTNPTALTTTLPGLVPGVPIHYCFAAINGGVEIDGADATVTPIG